MNKKTYAILAIDLQNDFVKPDGALSVPNAENDAKRVAEFIRKNTDNIDYIALTLDSHRGNHIAHPTWFKDKDGNHPNPFSVITAQDLKDGKWTPTIGSPLQTIKYLEELEAKGKQHMIWNEHCIIGTEGWAIYKDVIDSVIEWEVKNKRPYDACFKGQNWYTEHFSIFKGEVVLPNYPETALNQGLLNTLNKFDTVFLVGEAASHCVSESLNDILDIIPDLAKKVVVFEDCMSWIGTKEQNQRAMEVFKKAEQMGVQIMKSTDFKF